MMGVITGLLKPMLRQWWNMNRSIDPNVLAVNLSSATVDFANNLLGSKIIVPTWQSIQEANSSINWVSIL